MIGFLRKDGLSGSPSKRDLLLMSSICSGVGLAIVSRGQSLRGEIVDKDTGPCYSEGNVSNESIFLPLKAAKMLENEAKKDESE